MFSVYTLMSFFYFTIAIYFSHYAYRHFKAMNQQGLLGGMNFMPPANPGGAAEPTDYRRVQEPQQQTRPQGYFQGDAVRIG